MRAIAWYSDVDAGGDDDDSSDCKEITEPITREKIFMITVSTHSMWTENERIAWKKKQSTTMRQMYKYRGMKKRIDYRNILVDRTNNIPNSVKISFIASSRLSGWLLAFWGSKGNVSIYFVWVWVCVTEWWLQAFWSQKLKRTAQKKSKTKHTHI